MTARMDALNMLYRDFKVASDVSEMLELRRFDVEYTVYGSLFREDGRQKYIISTKEDKIIAYNNQREHFKNSPLPVQTHTLRTTVPAGSEEDFLQLVKKQLAIKIRDSYDPDFLSAFYALEETEPDDAGEPILTQLQECLCGLYRRENLVLFEGLMDRAYRAKHLTETTVKGYESWLNEEIRQLEDEPVVMEQFEKDFFGILYTDGAVTKRYCNAERSKVYQKKAELEKRHMLVTPVLQKHYWHSYEETVKDVRQKFENDLLCTYDETYLSYLYKIDALTARVSEKAFKIWEMENSEKNAMMAEAIALYRFLWGIK